MKNPLCCLGLLLVLCSLAIAQTKDGVVPINGGRNFVYVKPIDTSFPATKPPAGLVTIYSNLGTGTNVYNGGAGTGVLGRIRWFGWYPKPTEIANFPVQGTGADIVNARSIELAPYAARLDAPLVLQVHDALYYDCPDENVEALKKKIVERWAEPIALPGGPCILPIDLHTGQRWSDLG